MRAVAQLEHAYDDLQRPDSAGEEAREWLRAAGCAPRLRDGRWIPDFDCAASCAPSEALEARIAAACLPVCAPEAGTETTTDDTQAPGQTPGSARGPDVGTRPGESGAAGGGVRCAPPPVLSLSPAQPVAGAAVTARLLDREDSTKWRPGDDAGVSWAFVAARPMRVAEPLGRTGTAYAVVSADPGSATIAVAVCGGTDVASVVWLPRGPPWWRQPLTWAVAAVGAVSAHAIWGTR